MTDTVTREHRSVEGNDLTEAFRREAPGLLGFFLRRDVPGHDAADLVSETFLAAWRGIGRHRIDMDMLRAWLFGIARKVLSQYRRGRLRRSALADRVRSTLEDDGTARSDGSAGEAESELILHTRELIRHLPALDREIVRLVYWEGFSQEEVAVIIGKPATAVRSRLSRARSALRAQLTD